MRQRIEKTTERRGDTLIEVMLSISIFAMVSLLTINMMNNGINTAQRTLETEMARNEIDAQAEALRYIHNNYVAERNMDNSQFRDAWNSITAKAMKPSDLVDKESETFKAYFDVNNMETCDDAYVKPGGHLDSYNAFIINPRLLIPNNFSNSGKDQTMAINHGDIEYLGVGYKDLLDEMLVYYRNGEDASSKFASPSLYPRIIYSPLQTRDGNKNSGKTTENGALYDGTEIYNKIERAEGIWINVAGNNNNKLDVKRSDYFDFYIRTCWQSAGTNTPSTITTVVRLYNPEVME